MARFSQSTRGSQTTTNYEGGEAFKLSPELELYSAVCTASLQNKLYEKSGKTLTRIRSLVKKCDNDFVAKLAVYAREKMYLRSVPLVLAVELERKKGRNPALVRTVTSRVIQRADELYEVLAYFGMANERKDGLKPVAHSLLKGVADAFPKFDEYQFAKYRGEDKNPNLRDAMFLARPKPPRGKKTLYKKVAENKLETPDTWEVALSAGGSKKEAWEKLILSRKIPYMAAMRNLRNMAQAEISADHWEIVLDMIKNPALVRKSRQFPFRYLAAYRELESAGGWAFPRIATALEEAVKVACENIQGFDTNTKVVIAGDVSGSMYTPISQKSSMQMYEVGLILASMLQYRCQMVRTGIFGSEYKEIQVPQSNILANARTFCNSQGGVGHATNGWKIINWAIKNRIEADKFVFFTDCQWWDSTGWGTRQRASKYWADYRKQINPKAKAYYFDVAGYGTTPISTASDGVYLISGWSEKVFNVLSALERGESALSEVKKIEL